MTNVENMRVEKELIQKVIDNREYNKTILDHYSQAIKDEDFKSHFHNRYNEVLYNASVNISNCNKFWLIDHFEVQKKKQLISQNLCRNKFCANCKKVRQSARMGKYIPELEKYNGKLYHMVLTQPNVSGEDLGSMIKHMAKCFKYLIQYLRGDRNTDGIDFSSWGYEGAIRSLEVTFKGDSYHPHYHVALVLNDDVLGKKNITEELYSYSSRGGARELKRLFCEEEILIQKIWYLLINKTRVNKKNIDALEHGYSCMIDKFEEDHYIQMFKYLTKEKDDDGEIFSYDNFKTLYYSLYNVKQIQGYGVLYRINDNIDLEEIIDSYKVIISEMRKKEKPSTVLETPEDLLNDDVNTLISLKSYMKYIRQCMSEDNYNTT